MTTSTIPDSIDLTELSGMEAFVLADQMASAQVAAPELDVRIHDNQGFALGQCADYISTTATFKRNKVGPGTIVLKGDDPWGPVGMTCQKTVVPTTIRTDNYKWTGRVDSCSKDTVDGITTYTMQLVDDKSWYDHILIFPTWFSPVEFQPIKNSVHIGPAVTSIKALISEQGLRLNSGLWNIVNNIVNPAAVFADLVMKFEFAEDLLDGNGVEVDVPFVVVPTNPLTDTSKWTALTARMDTISACVEQALKDNGLELKAWMWEPGDEQPAPDWFILTRPTIVFDVVDKTNVQHITGTALDGLIGTAVELSDTLFGEIVFAITGSNVSDQYLTDATNPYGGILSQWLGLNSKPPWVIYEDGPYSGIKESHITAHHPLAWQIVGGGKSPEWVNKGIDLILEALLGAVIAAAAAASGGAAAAISAIPNTLLDGVFDDMILAFQLITNFARKRSLGKFGWPEFFTQTGGTAWTLNELVALEAAMWDSRGYFSFQMVTRDGSPYTFGDGPNADFFLCDPVSWIDAGVIYTDYCDEAVITDDRNNYDLTITIGDGSAQEAPVTKLMRYVSSADNAIKAITLAA